LRLAQSAADALSMAELDVASYRSDSSAAAFPARVVITVPGGDARAVADAVRQGRIIGESVNFTRSLANEPGNVLPPREFADRIAAAASAAGLGVDVLDEDRIKALNMRLLMGVAQGSAEPPRVVVLRHEPAGAPASPVIGLIGKGITFDS